MDRAPRATSRSPRATVAVLAVVALLVLAGCAMPLTDGQSTPNGGESTAAPGDGDPDGATDGTGPDGATGDTEPAADGTGAPPIDETLSPALEAPGPAPAADGDSSPASQQPDPESDALGWEAGYWYNDPVAASANETLNESALEAVVARAMARVEYVRGREFAESVDVSVVSRAEFGTDELGGGNESEALRTFDNAKFQALFMVPVGNDSLSVQDEALNSSVGGYYSTERDAIVIVADDEAASDGQNGTGATLTSERTLAHELVHALQDQHFDETETPDRLRDAYNGHNGLFEGDASAVQHAYMARCEAGQWRCLAANETAGAGQQGSTDGGDIHMGMYLLEFFPYADGPSLVAHLAADDGWDGVDDAYDRIPTSATEVIYPGRYGSFEPSEVDLADDPRGGWERVRPPNRPDYGRLGQSALTAAFAYTIYDRYNLSYVVSPRTLLNGGVDGVDPTDPLNYDIPQVGGWTGDRLHAYERDGEVASVWRLSWESPAAADRFARGYRTLLGYWDASRVEPSTYRLAEESPFGGAVYVDVDGDTVTVVRAPSTSDLGEVYPGAR